MCKGWKDTTYNITRWKLQHDPVHHKQRYEVLLVQKIVHVTE